MIPSWRTPVEAGVYPRLPTFPLMARNFHDNVSVLLREIEERFARLSALDRTILDTSRVLLFVKSVDERDREQVGLLLETEDGLKGRLGRGKKSLQPFQQTAGMG